MKQIKRTACGIMAGILLFLSMPLQVLAANGENYVTGDNSYRQPVPQAYNVIRTVNNIGDFEDKKLNFKNPQDIFIDKYDNIYIVDTGNKRVVKMDKNYKTLGVFYGDEKGFDGPEGIFADDDGDMYIADTGNKRIVHLDNKGNFVEQFTNPESADVSTGEAFSPSKLVVSNTGYIYVVRGENIMIIDGNGEFRGFFGQTNIGYSLWEAMMRIFASEEQKAFITKRLASSFINATLGNDGMIYATSMEREEGEIKKMNSIGINVYRKYKTVGNSISNPVTDFINKKLLKSVVAGKSFKFGEYFDDDGNYMEPVFADICVDKNGIVTVIEQTNGKVYQYDQDGNMLVAFGGYGESKGTFTRAASIAVNSEGLIFILDRINNNFQVFEPTDFIKLIQDATTSFNKGDYATSAELWKQVLKTDESYNLAHVGIAKTYYKQEMYKEAMDEAKIAVDRDLYTMAFNEYKYVVMREHFLPIILAAVAIIAFVIFVVVMFLKFTKKAFWSYLESKNRKMKIGEGLLFCGYSAIHPVDCLDGLRYNKKRINMAVPFIIFVLAYAVRMFYLLYVHFPLATIETLNINPIFEAVKLLIVPLTWIPASFAATSIAGGECKIPEITFTSAMSLVPYILVFFPLTFLSHIMSKTQQGWYGIFNIIAYFGMFLILFQAMRIMNNYRFGETIKMMLISAFMMAVILLVALIVYSLSARLIQFIIGIITEFRLNFL
ncbi:MAG: NHL repeat-containing protein [Lachnospiraceae bacterium]|nr:NHL repeat-containing protein [Lachnospiraceae bacterium]